MYLLVFSHNSQMTILKVNDSWESYNTCFIRWAPNKRLFEHILTRFFDPLVYYIPLGQRWVGLLFYDSYVISTPTCRNWKIWNPKVAFASKVYMSQRVKFTALKSS